MLAADFESYFDIDSENYRSRRWLEWTYQIVLPSYTYIVTEQTIAGQLFGKHALPLQHGIDRCWATAC
jgi:hypothetical protein